jgi:hypothetical protein
MWTSATKILITYMDVCFLRSWVDRLKIAFRIANGCLGLDVGVKKHDDETTMAAFALARLPNHQRRASEPETCTNEGYVCAAALLKICFDYL